MKRLVYTGLLLAAAFLAVAASAQAARFRAQTSIEPDGTGWMFANGSGPWKWEACTAGPHNCQPFAKGREVKTTGAPAGTVFRLTDGSGETGLSPEWRGPPKNLSPPGIAGLVVANEFVSPIPGIWSGGWKGEDSEMQLAACTGEAGRSEECVSLTNPHFIRTPGCTSANSFALDPTFVGRYLRVADRQSGGPHPEPAFGVSGPYGAEVWGRSRSTSVAVVGQIAPATSAPAGECGPPPPPTSTVSAEGIARVECPGGCSVVLVGTRDGRKQTVSRSVPSQSLLMRAQALELKLSSAALGRLGAGKIRLTVVIDGVRSAQRTIFIPAS